MCCPDVIHLPEGECEVTPTRIDRGYVRPFSALTDSQVTVGYGSSAHFSRAHAP